MFTVPFAPALAPAPPPPQAAATSTIPKASDARRPLLIPCAPPFRAPVRNAFCDANCAEANRSCDGDTPGRASRQSQPPRHPTGSPAVVQDVAPLLRASTLRDPVEGDPEHHDG